MPLPPTSLLSITGITIPENAIRGCTVDLSPIPQATSLRRDINANYIDTSAEQFRKYQVTITCTDHEAPELTGVWPGHAVTVTLIPFVGVHDDSDSDDDATLTLSCKVKGWRTTRDEYEAETGWVLELEQT